MARSLPPLVFLLLAVAAPGPQALLGAGLSGVGPVYFLPMPAAFDQYLAQEAAASGVFPVVVDPKLARAMMTDRVDAEFLATLEEVFPPEEPAPEEGKGEKEEQEEKSADSIEGDFRLNRPKNRPLSRPRGTLFLVDMRSRKVVWSAYVKEHDLNPDRLQQKAREVIEQIRKELGGG